MRTLGLGFRGLGFRVQGLRFGVWGLGVGVQTQDLSFGGSGSGTDTTIGVCRKLCRSYTGNDRAASTGK